MNKEEVINIIRKKHPHVNPRTFYDIIYDQTRIDIRCDFSTVIEFAVNLEVQNDNALWLNLYEKLSKIEIEKAKEYKKSIISSANNSNQIENKNCVVAAGGLRRIHVTCQNKQKLTEEQVLEEVKRLCEEVGVDIEIKDNTGLTAEARASIKGYKTVVGYLKSRKLF